MRLLWAGTLATITAEERLLFLLGAKMADASVAPSWLSGNEVEAARALAELRP